MVVSSPKRAADTSLPFDPDQTDDAPEVPGPDPVEDIAEAKELVATLKAARAAREAAAVAIEADIGATETSMDISPAKGRPSALKRALEEVSPVKIPLTLVPRENEDDSMGDRVIATNNRVQVTPQNKSLGVGLLAFTFAAGALYFAPFF